jgi:hypothetical protein
MLCLRKLRDVGSGVPKGDKVATARQPYWIVEGSFPAPDHSFRPAFFCAPVWATYARADRSGDISLLSIPADLAMLENRLRSLSREHSPRCFEVFAGLVEGFRGAVCAFSRMAARIEATSSAPRVFVMRNSSAEGDRADAHVAVTDAPAFVASVGRASAGEGRACADDSADLM